MDTADRAGDRAEDRARERVGVIALLIIAGLVAGLLVADDCQVGDDIHVTVYLEHLGGLHEGAAFQVAGRAIGEVEGISLVPAHRAGAGHPLYPTGGVALVVRIADEHRAMTSKNGEVFISTKGVFGEKYLEMGIPPGGQERQPPLADGDAVRGVDPPHLDRVLMRSYRNIQLARAFMDEIRPEWDELMAALDQLAGTMGKMDAIPEARLVGLALGRVIDDARAVKTTLDAAGVSRAEVADLMARGRALAARLDGDLGVLSTRIDHLAAELGRIRDTVPTDALARLEGALRAAEGARARLEAIVADARAIAAMIRRGEGTIGALWNDPEFPEHAKSLGRLIKKHPWRLLGHESVGDPDP